MAHSRFVTSLRIQPVGFRCLPPPRTLAAWITFARTSTAAGNLRPMPPFVRGPINGLLQWRGVFFAIQIAKLASFQRQGAGP
jgi:hypothetical protein